MTMPNDGTPPTPPVQQTVDWEAKFKGLQGEFQKLQGIHATLQEAHKGLTDKYTTLNGQHEVLTGDHIKLVTERDGLKNEVTKATGQFSRLQLIANDFPALLPFEKDGTLPAGEGDELKGKLSKFSASLEALGKNAATTAVQGAVNMTTPPANTAPPARGLKEIQGEMFKALSDGSPEAMARYEELGREEHAFRVKRETERA